MKKRKYNRQATVNMLYLLTPQSMIDEIVNTPDYFDKGVCVLDDKTIKKLLKKYG